MKSVFGFTRHAGLLETGIIFGHGGVADFRLTFMTGWNLAASLFPGFFKMSQFHKPLGAFISIAFEHIVNNILAVCIKL